MRVFGDCRKIGGVEGSELNDFEGGVIKGGYCHWTTEPEVAIVALFAPDVFLA